MCIGLIIARISLYYVIIIVIQPFCVCAFVIATAQAETEHVDTALNHSNFLNLKPTSMQKSFAFGFDTNFTYGELSLPASDLCDPDRSGSDICRAIQSVDVEGKTATSDKHMLLAHGTPHANFHGPC